MAETICPGLLQWIVCSLVPKSLVFLREVSRGTSHEGQHYALGMSSFWSQGTRHSVCCCTCVIDGHKKAFLRSLKLNLNLEFLYSASHRETWPAALYNHRKWQLIGKSQWCCSAKCGRSLHVLTHNWTHGKQPANTVPPQSTASGLHPVSIHQMAPPERTSDCSIVYSFIDRLMLLCCLFTFSQHSKISGSRIFMWTPDLPGGPKIAQFLLYALTSSNINGFSKLFHCQNQEKTCNNTITKDPTTPILWSVFYLFGQSFSKPLDTWHFTR